MKRVKQPDFGVKDILEELIEGRGVKEDNKQAIKDNFGKWSDYFEKIEKEYVGVARESKLEKLNKESLDDLDTDNVRGQINDFDEVTKKIYKDFSSELRSRFPTIHSPVICPICEGDLLTNTTLEHIIPSSSIPHLRFLPMNLMVSCRECNSATHSHRTEGISEINLYFESYEELEKHFIIKFSYDDVFKPVLELDSKVICDEVNDKRIRQFVKDYNLMKTYSHRINLIYSKLLIEISKYDFINSENLAFSREMLIKWLENKKSTFKKEYQNDVVICVDSGEKLIRLSLDYFGFLLCDALSEALKNDETISRLAHEIVKFKGVDSLAYENVRSSYDLIEKFQFSGEDKEECLTKIQELLINYEVDYLKYFRKMMEIQPIYQFEFLGFSEEYAGEEKRIIQEILRYYINVGVGFGSFKESCISLLKLSN